MRRPFEADPSALRDFHPVQTPLPALAQTLTQNYPPPPGTPCSRETFLALLCGIAVLRKTPGIPGPSEAGPNAFTTLPQCASEADVAACRTHLKTMFGITDKESLRDFCNREIRVHENYLDFESFWENRPAFALEELNEGGRAWFCRTRDFAAQFYPLLGRHGFLGWDISECMGHLRAAYACGLLQREELDDLAGFWLQQAATFENWTEYALSLVCGAFYWDFRHGADNAQVERDAALWMNLTGMLLSKESAWGSGLWYTPPGKQYAIPAADIRPLLCDWEGPAGCIASDRITVDGCRVGWCYRETPSENYPDSGWRFFAGDESSEYTNDPDHAGIYALNTICNSDPDILPLLRAPVGAAFCRDSKGVFRQERFTPPED